MNIILSEILNLVVVLVLSAGMLYLLYRLKRRQQVSSHISIIANMPVGQKERLVIIESFNKKILIGVTQQQINLIHIFNDDESITMNMDHELNDQFKNFKEFLTNNIN